MHVSIQQAGYDVGQPVLQEIAFALQPGSITGLIGTNGAGKSTTIQAMFGTLPWVEGEIDLPVSLAYIPEQPTYYEYLTLAEHLELVASLHETDHAYTEQLLKTFELRAVTNDYVSSFSKGMKQKVMLVCALMQRADCLIIDEPFVGLDAVATIRLLHLLEAERTRGVAILLVTHVLDSAERLCDDFVWIDQGRIKHQGTLAQIGEASGQPDARLFDIMEAMVLDHD